MKKIDKPVIMLIALVVLIFLIVFFYLFARESNYLPNTEVFLSNTTVLGKVLGF